ncbi:MAG: Rrf2 family transcriptional regulator [Candidatus Omnitrophica bacterium]|nr:Rrf2 family transcriptional regulator [Candidatus Omnitrophota bacterium]
MKITAQEEYGLRCLLQLAKNGVENGVTVKEIAQKEGLSPAYVEKLLRHLNQAGLTQSVRGTKGGYHLTRKPEEISLGSVVRALGKVPSTQEICDRFTGNLTSCVHINDCCVRSAWASLTRVMENFLDGIFLSDLLGAEKGFKI